jgi:hypothetical protein
VIAGWLHRESVSEQAGAGRDLARERPDLGVPVDREPRSSASADLVLLRVRHAGDNDCLVALLAAGAAASQRVACKRFAAARDSAEMTVDLVSVLAAERVLVPCYPPVKRDLAGWWAVGVGSPSAMARYSSAVSSMSRNAHPRTWAAAGMRAPHAYHARAAADGVFYEADQFVAGRPPRRGCRSRPTTRPPGTAWPGHRCARARVLSFVDSVVSKESQCRRLSNGRSGR